MKSYYENDPIQRIEIIPTSKCPANKEEFKKNNLLTYQRICAAVIYLTPDGTKVFYTNQETHPNVYVRIIQYLTDEKPSWKINEQ